MKICILSNGYPTSKTASCVFVAKLSDEFADLGHNVTIIAPQSVSSIIFRKGVFSDIDFEHKTQGGHNVRVLRPKVFTFGKLPFFKRLNGKYFLSAIRKVIVSLGEQDVYYGHFWNNAFILYECTKKYGKPLFVATGESTIKLKISNTDFVNYVTGVIGVSTKNINESISLGLTTKDKCVLLPNAIDSNEFRIYDKMQCRRELGIPNDLFVVIFAANFTERKGSLRLASAIDMCNDDKIGVLFLGRPVENDPNCKGIIKKGFVNHSDVVKYMNAADVYVLPTLAEGCCNSIVEAMACGLPIISSDLPFNEDILDETNSILVDPKNVSQISNAIMILKNNPELCKSMSNSSLKKAKELDLTNRAKKILLFIEQKIEQNV